MQWFYAKEGGQRGPVSDEEIERLVRSREITEADLVWHDGMENWTPAGRVPALAAMIPGENPAAHPPAVSPYTPPAAQAAPPAYVSSAPPVASYLWQSIVATLLCCMPAGIVAIVYASKVEGLWRAGDLEGARRSAQQAKLWCNISVGLALLLIIFGLVAGWFGGESSVGG